MVESESTVMVLPLPAATSRTKERTGYHLQPTSMQLTHDGLLPAAALSNFFKAPAKPISGKLPSIGISSGKPLYRSKSIHQRNKCLAEVIQSQLVELKKLQDKYRCQRLESRALRLSQPKSSPEETNCSSNKPNTTCSHADSRKHELVSSATPPSTQFMSKNRLIKPTVLNKPPQHTQENYPDTPLKFLTDTQPKLQPETQPKFPPDTQPKLQTDTQPKFQRITSFTVSSPTKLNLRAKQLDKRGNGKLISIDENAMTHHNNCYMDPEKHSLIYEWVKSVEAAHRLEGKWSEVISIPDADLHSEIRSSSIKS